MCILYKFYVVMTIYFIYIKLLCFSVKLLLNQFANAADYG